MRTFLRLDFLYSQALYHNEMGSHWGSRAAMGEPDRHSRHHDPRRCPLGRLKELERQLDDC